MVADGSTPEIAISLRIENLSSSVPISEDHVVALKELARRSLLRLEVELSRKLVELLALVGALQEETRDISAEQLFSEDPILCHARLEYWVAATRWLIEMLPDSTRYEAQRAFLSRLIQQLHGHVRKLRDQNPRFFFVRGLQEDFEPLGSWETWCIGAHSRLRDLETRERRRTCQTTPGIAKARANGSQKQGSPGHRDGSASSIQVPRLCALVETGKRVILIGGEPGERIDRHTGELPFLIEWVPCGRPRELENVCAAISAGSVAGILFLGRWASHAAAENLKKHRARKPVPIAYLRRDGLRAIKEGLVQLEGMLVGGGQTTRRCSAA